MGAPPLTRGTLVATGNTSDVLQWTRTTVVKLLRPGIPSEWAQREADVVDRVHAAGLPVPATEGTVEIGGRVGIVFERIDGESMWDRMKAWPSELPRLVGALVDLQTDFHHAPPIAEMPPLVPRVRQKIDAAQQVSAEDRREALSLLDRLPTMAALCHGDMHPANILMSSRGMIVVDWFDAASGHPVADQARSALLMRPVTPARPAPPLPAAVRDERAFLPGATHAFLTRLHDAYLAALVDRGLMRGVQFAKWQAVLAVARLSEPVEEDDLAGIWTSWRAGASGALVRPG